MTNSLVKLLRQCAREDVGGPPEANVMWEAADRIETLEGALRHAERGEDMNIETIARIMAEWCNGGSWDRDFTEEQKAYWLRKTPEALRALNEAGFAVVPREPTLEMSAAGRVQFRHYCFRHMEGHPAVWEAMLAAAVQKEGKS